ncbi:MAG: bifunctional diaminohydroxyphosphoribosylaminopyrimidine deaminase/5-amino-6-(5-phosphoribosylamino)uracil reductase RibD [Planctomycetota bacterium]
MVSERAAFERALAEAARGRGEVEPNPCVGAALARGDQIVGVGFHAAYGEAHAEAALLDAAGSLKGCVLYVTLEPCSHHGKTPPCADAVIAARPDRVVVLNEDPNPKVAGRGLARLREAGLETSLSTDEELRQRERDLNRRYHAHRARERAWVVAKWAMTLDGKIASRGGDSKWISSKASRQEVHRLRAHVDAVLIGAGTALQDDPRLTPRDVPIVRSPTRVVLDSHGRLPESAKLLQDIERFPLRIFTTERSCEDWRKRLEARGALLTVQPGVDRVDLEAVLVELRNQKLERVLLEGGSELLGSAFDAQLIDMVDAYVCPRLLGGQDAKTPWPGQGRETMAEALTLDDAQWRSFESDQRLRGFVKY